MSNHTPEPWHWNLEDYSMATLSGPDYMEQHVLAVSPCDSCLEVAKKKSSDQKPSWKWGRCMTPTKANADRIVACVNACKGINPEAVPDLLEALERCVSAMCNNDGSQDADTENACAVRRAGVAISIAKGETSSTKK